MNINFDSLLKQYRKDSDGIYLGKKIDNCQQLTEINLRTAVAKESYKNYFDRISMSHSIPVMDHEVQIFLSKMPKNAVILDIGGCWGWHWRKIAQQRPDLNVLIIDFIRENLLHAKRILGEIESSQVALMHMDAIALPLNIGENVFQFNGIWTVQTLQHIPNFDLIISKIYMSLKSGGTFVNYSLCDQTLIKFIYKIFNRKYHIKGNVNNEYYLERASESQKKIIEHYFKSVVTERWSEILFSPELLFFRPGIQSSLVGMLDAHLSNNIGFLKSLARQHSFECRKQ